MFFNVAIFRIYSPKVSWLYPDSFRRWCVRLAFSAVVVAGPVLALDAGQGKITLTAQGKAITVFTYYPSSCGKPSLLMVFHGLNRKAESLRNKAIKVANEGCFIVFAPHFDKARFPNWRYQRAGVVRKGRVQPRQQWTAWVVQDLLAQARQQVGNKHIPLYLFGHSAGGQFLSRIAAYSPPANVSRIIIANPSAYVAPLVSEVAPYGFSGVFSSDEIRAHIKAYLALPITIYIGQKDTGEKYLVKSDEAMRQGQHRLARGRYIYQLAEGIAAHEKWTFNWRIVEAPNVGHSSRGMLNSHALFQALGVTPKAELGLLPVPFVDTLDFVDTPHFVDVNSLSDFETISDFENMAATQ